MFPMEYGQKLRAHGSKLAGKQLSLLESWDCGRNSNEIIKNVETYDPRIPQTK